MILSRFLAYRLSLDRLRAYAVIFLTVTSVLLAFSFIKRSNGLTVFGTPLGGDYVAFYTSGKLVSAKPDRLYDLKAQDQMVHETIPAAPADQSMPYVNPPFFTLPFIPLARLPFAVSYFAWLLISIALYVSAVLIALRLNPALPQCAVLIFALAFPAFSIFVLQGGQVSAFGVVVLSLAFYLTQSERQIASGLVLSLLLYKPPLLLFLLPMIALKRQWRTLLGFVVGGALLSAVSWLMVGTVGLINYATLLRTFYAANNTTGEIFQTAKYVDLGAAIRLLTGSPAGLIRFIILAGAFPLLLMKWRKSDSRSAWGLAIAATLLLNLYSPIYDCAFLVLPIIWLGPKKIGNAIFFVFVASLISVPIAQVAHVQLMTVALMYFVWRLANRQTESGVEITYERVAISSAELGAE